VWQAPSNGAVPSRASRVKASMVRLRMVVSLVALSR
jgi:hypothetical protein